MVIQLKVTEVACVEGTSPTRQVAIACGDQGQLNVSLIFDASISQKETDALRDLLRWMKLTTVTVETR
jgi:hypothetical protein